MIIAHFLYETFKRDVTHDILPSVSYPTTFRRQVIDFAAKVVSTGGEIILKVTQTVYEKLNIQEIWRRSGAPQTYFVTWSFRTNKLLKLFKNIKGIRTPPLRDSKRCFR